MLPVMLESAQKVALSRYSEPSLLAEFALQERVVSYVRFEGSQAVCQSLTGRACCAAAGPERVAISALLATGRVHHHLVATQARTLCPQH